MATDTTDLSYWLNWRFLLCAIWITATMIVAALIIWKYEGRSRANGNRRSKGVTTWTTSSNSINPIWLLIFRIVAFCAMLALLIADSILYGVGIFYFYTQWTFTLVTIYFGIGSSLSILGCLRCCLQEELKRDRFITADAENSSFIAPALLREDEDEHNTKTSLNDDSRTAFVCENAFQILFQMCAGAVVLTDSVYWLVLYPFYSNEDYKLTFMDVSFHSVNAIFLLGDTVLNSMSFPFFRIAYFSLWTCVFVVFQWILHVFVSMSWPYTFLDLSSPYAPLWYLAVGLMHVPCYGIFYLIFKIKVYVQGS